MRTLVTGASGFVGNNLTRRLLQDGHEVHVLLRSGHAPWRIQDIRNDLRIHLVDLNDREGLTELVEGIRPKWIFHLAVYGGYPSQTDVPQILQTNIFGTANLVEACLKTGFDALVNTGSSSEYGYKDHAPSENERPEPNSHYAVAKAASTLYCQFTARNRKVRIPTLRLYSVYGPYEEPGRLVPKLITLGLKGQLPPLADPRIARDFIFIDDVVDAYLLAAGTKSGAPDAVYNIGTGIQTNLEQAVEVARRVLKIPVEPQWGSMEQRNWDTTVWVADNRKIQKELGWNPRFSFESGFLKTVEWFRQNSLRYQSQYQN